MKWSKKLVNLQRGPRLMTPDLPCNLKALTEVTNNTHSFVPFVANRWFVCAAAHPLQQGVDFIGGQWQKVAHNHRMSGSDAGGMNTLML